jgi:hypothetical protein
MIATLRRDAMGYVLDPTEGGDMWLSPGGLAYLRHGGYDPESMHRVSVFLIDLLLAQGHLCPLSEAPRLGAFLDAFEPVAAARPGVDRPKFCGH